MQKEKKTEIITLRVTLQTKDRIQAKARELSLTVTDYLCLCGLGKKIVRVDGLDKVLSELKAQGRNLNQLTTLANMGKITVVYGDRLAESYRSLGIAYLKSQEYDKAKEAFKSSLSSMKHKDAEFSRDVMYYEAETCVQAGDLDGAIEICTNIQEEKADADALFLRGRAYFLQKNYEQAKVDFDAAVETKESYQLCLDIYELYQESSMKADGDRYLEAAVKIEPKTTEDYYNIGCAYYYLEEQDEAVKAFSKAMKDGSSAAMEMLGEVYLSNGQNDEAKALFSSYLSTDGFAAAANNGLALCALAENDTDSALSYIEEGLKTAEDSDRENLLFNQIVSYEKRADFDTAKSLMADFLAAYPENTAAQRENTFLQNR